MSSVRQRRGARAAPASPPATPIRAAETPDATEAVESSPIKSEVPKRVSTQSRLGWLVDFLLVVVLLASGLYLRLTSIDNPNKIVFDEVHFTQFATWYLSVSVRETQKPRPRGSVTCIASIPSSQGNYFGVWVILLQHVPQLRALPRGNPLLLATRCAS